MCSVAINLLPDRLREGRENGTTAPSFGWRSESWMISQNACCVLYLAIKNNGLLKKMDCASWRESIVLSNTDRVVDGVFLSLPSARQHEGV